jgi:sugar phosphate isomerase/epimerase
VKGFGINTDAAHLDGSLDTLARDLEFFAGLGFDYVEIPVHGVGAMAGGRLLPQRVKEVCRLLAKYPFHYTVHSPNPLNLMDEENLTWQKEALGGSLEFAAAIGSGALVYHSGRYVPEEYFHLPGRSNALDEHTRAEMRWRERNALQELGELAGRLGVVIGMENARPYLDGSPYCYAEQLSLLVAQVQAINHPQVGITLDTGHAYLAACYYGFDFLGTVALAAPYVRHVHLHDNFGRVCGSLEKKQGELLATGRGDLHLPVGRGEIPAAEVLAILLEQGYSGVVIHEIRPRYQEHAGQALATGRTLVKTVGK